MIFICLFVCGGVKQVLIIWASSWVFYKRQKLPIILGGGGVGLVGTVLLIFLAFCGVWFFFQLVSCLPNIAIVSVLSIHDCRVGFSKEYNK